MGTEFRHCPCGPEVDDVDVVDALRPQASSSLCFVRDSVPGVVMSGSTRPAFSITTARSIFRGQAEKSLPPRFYILMFCLLLPSRLTEMFF